MPLRAAVLAMVGLVVAGCTAPLAPQEPGAQPAPAPEAAPEPAGKEPPPGQEPSSPAPAGAASTLSRPYAFDGTTEGEACLQAAGAEECIMLTPASNALWDFPDARVVRAEGEVRWTPATPAAREMQVVLYVAEGSAWQVVEGAAVVGPSPLGYAWDLAPFPADARFRMGVFQGMEAGHPASAGAYLGTAQAFTVEGKLYVAPGGEA